MVELILALPMSVKRMVLCSQWWVRNKDDTSFISVYSWSRVPGLTSSWGAFSNYGDQNGVDASEACCACGATEPCTLHVHVHVRHLR